MNLSALTVDFKDIDEITEIEPHIFVGTEKSANNSELLKKKGITHIINCSQSENINETTSNYLSLYMKDDMSCSLLPYIPVVYVFIETAISDRVDENRKVIQKGGNVLVHCRMGRSRSPAVLMAYMMKKHNYTYQKAYSLFQSKYRYISINQYFEQQLIEFERSNWNSFLAHQMNLYRKVINTELYLRDDTYKNFHTPFTYMTITNDNERHNLHLSNFFQRTYRCKHCHCNLFSGVNILYHIQSLSIYINFEGTSLSKQSKLTKVDLNNSQQCDPNTTQSHSIMNSNSALSSVNTSSSLSTLHPCTSNLNTQYIHLDIDDDANRIPHSIFTTTQPSLFSIPLQQVNEFEMDEDSDTIHKDSHPVYNYKENTPLLSSLSHSTQRPSYTHLKTNKCGYHLPELTNITCIAENHSNASELNTNQTLSKSINTNQNKMIDSIQISNSEFDNSRGDVTSPYHHLHYSPDENRNCNKQNTVINPRSQSVCILHTKESSDLHPTDITHNTSIYNDSSMKKNCLSNTITTSLHPKAWKQEEEEDLENLSIEEVPNETDETGTQVLSSSSKVSNSLSIDPKNININTQINTKIEIPSNQSVSLPHRSSLINQLSRSVHKNIFDSKLDWEQDDDLDLDKSLRGYNDHLTPSPLVLTPYTFEYMNTNIPCDSLSEHIINLSDHTSLSNTLFIIKYIACNIKPNFMDDTINSFLHESCFCINKKCKLYIELPSWFQEQMSSLHADKLCTYNDISVNCPNPNCHVSIGCLKQQDTCLCGYSVCNCCEIYNDAVEYI